MLKTIIAGAIGLPAILLLGFFLGGLVGGALMAAGIALAVMANTIASAGASARERRAAEAALARGSPPKAVLILTVLVVVGALTLGAVSRVEGVLAFCNRIAALPGFTIRDWQTLGASGAVAGAVLGAVGGLLRRAM